jgi:hypothetical protein
VFKGGFGTCLRAASVRVWGRRFAERFGRQLKRAAQRRSV